MAYQYNKQRGNEGNDFDMVSLRLASPERIKEWSFNDQFMQKLMPLCHTRIKNFGDFMDLCHFFFINKKLQSPT